MRVRFTAACAEVEQQLGRHDEAHARLLAALDEQTDRESEAGVALLVALATDGFYGMHYDGIVAWGETAARRRHAPGRTRRCWSPPRPCWPWAAPSPAPLRTPSATATRRRRWSTP